MFDLICRNVVCLLTIKMALHFDYYGTPINNLCRKGGMTGNTWELGNSLSNSLVTV